METGIENTPLRNAAALGPLGLRVVCDHCPGSILRPTRISTVLWQGDALVVVRNIPGMVCPTCGEDYVDDAVVVDLDRRRGERFAGMAPVERMTVPVYDFGGPE